MLNYRIENLRRQVAHSGRCELPRSSCRVKLVSGRVTMAVEDALTDQDRAEGYILACQAKVQGDIEVDA